MDTKIQATGMLVYGKFQTEGKTMSMVDLIECGDNGSCQALTLVWGGVDKH